MMFRLLFFVLLASAIGSAGPVGLARLDRLIDQSFVVVVGTVVQGVQSGPSVSVVIEVRRTLKGSVGSGLLNAEMTTSNEFAMSRSLKGIQGLWFLGETDGGRSYRVLPVMTGSVPFDFAFLPALPDLPPSWAAASSDTLTEKILRELSAALEDTGRSNVGLSGEFLSQLVAAPGSTVRGLYRRMLNSPAPVVWSAGLAGLVRSGDAEGLATLKLKLGQLAGQPYAGSVSQAVCEYFNGNPGGLRILAELAGSSQSIARLRECASFALRNVHSRESIPLLLSLLDSDKVEVRYEAVAGIASFANSGRIPNERPLTIDSVPSSRKLVASPAKEAEENFPTLDIFRRDETRIIQFWKRWVLDNAVAQSL